MSLRSFRLRIAVLSGLLAGSALIGYGLLSWRLIYLSKINSLDAKLENQLMRSIHPGWRNRWPEYEAEVSHALGADAAIAVLVVDKRGKPLYQSAAWPREFNVAPLFPPPMQFPSMKLPPDSQLPSADPEQAMENLEENFYRGQSNAPPPDLTEIPHATWRNWRIAAVSFPHRRTAIAVNLEAIDQESRVIRNIFLISVPGVLLLVAGGAQAIAGNALRSVHQLTAAIQRVTAKGLDQRVPIGTADVEFIELIQVFNQMLERLERSFKQASRFSGDAAHELKTPLAILQGELEQALQQAESGSEVQQSLSTLLDEVRRLSSIVRKLLLLSLADAGQMNLYRVAVNLVEILLELVEDMELLAPSLQVKTDLAADLWVEGDRDLLVQVLQNLFSNAIKYNVPNGWLAIQGRADHTTVSITISNASSDIASSDRQRIFDRFHRGDPARTRKVEGVGLGLSLSREIVRAHGGDLVLDATPPGQTAFTLTLPR